MDYSGSLAELLHIGYIIFVVFLTILIYSIGWFDLRNLSRKRSYETKREMQHGHSFSSFDFLARPDLGAIIGLLTIGGTILAAFIGFRIPAEIERVYGTGAAFGWIFPKVDMTVIGRTAEVVGAFCLGLIALRLLRLFVFLAGITAIIFAVFKALTYIF